MDNDVAYAAGISPSNAQSISLGKTYNGTYTFGKGSPHYYKFKTTDNINTRYTVSTAYTKGGDTDLFHEYLLDSDYSAADTTMCR